jgi:hypothetical protein
MNKGAKWSKKKSANEAKQAKTTKNIWKQHAEDGLTNLLADKL